MRLLLSLLPLLAAVACHGALGARTTKEDQDMAAFADARQRAATYYDGRDYVRAALQYDEALKYRPDHIPSRLGLAYSLTYTDLPSNMLRAQKEFEEIGALDDERTEVKRIYGLALAHRGLGVHFQRRARINSEDGRIRQADLDAATAREHALAGIEHFQRVIEIDKARSAADVAPRRVSASLAPDAHAGIAHCEILLSNAENLDHLDRALEHIAIYSKTAANARRFWEQRRERTLVVDPMIDDRQGDPGTALPTAQERELYELKIAGTIRKEVAMRRALVDTYLYLNRYADAIEECGTILGLDPSVDEVLFLRGRAYALLTPPNYRSAIADLKEYRSRQDLSKLTEELVGLNRRIRSYEKKLRDQEDAP
jgi:tetratricopeptide (TPR) repeat protein